MNSCSMHGAQIRGGAATGDRCDLTPLIEVGTENQNFFFACLTDFAQSHFPVPVNKRFYFQNRNKR